MKTVKEYKSFPIASVTHAISNDVNELIEREYLRQVRRAVGRDGHSSDLTFEQHASFRAYANAHAVGELQSLLTIAVMELHHKDHASEAATN